MRDSILESSWCASAEKLDFIGSPLLADEIVNHLRRLHRLARSEIRVLTPDRANRPLRESLFGRRSPLHRRGRPFAAWQLGSVTALW